MNSINAASHTTEAPTFHSNSAASEQLPTSLLENISSFGNSYQATQCENNISYEERRRRLITRPKETLSSDDFPSIDAFISHAKTTSSKITTLKLSDFFFHGTTIQKTKQLLDSYPDVHTIDVSGSYLDIETDIMAFGTSHPNIRTVIATGSWGITPKETKAIEKKCPHLSVIKGLSLQ